MSDKLSKYHQEKAVSSSGGPQSASNPIVAGAGAAPSVLNPGNMGNPMMKVSGGKSAAAMDTDSKNPMMPMSGNQSSQLPSESEVMETNPQGSGSNRASELLSKR